MMATERKSAAKQDLVVFNCTICLEPIVKPRYLPCSHTFCEECLQHFISREAIGREEASFEFKCPICRRVSGCPEQGVPVEEWAKHFPANLLLNSLTTSLEQQSDKLCAICLRDDKQVKAECWCHGCRELICPSCKGLHKIIVSLRTHKISAMNMKDQDDYQFPDMEEPCPVHPGKFVEVFCLNHSKLCCSICFATKHRHCEKVEALDDIAKGIPKSNVDRNIKVLSKIAMVTKEIIQHKEQVIKETNARKETILTNTSNEIENLKTKLDECQQQFEKTFLRLHEETNDKQKQCVLDLKQYLLTVRNGESLLSAVQQKGSAKQTFITAMKIITDVEEQLHQFKTNFSEDEEVQYEHDSSNILKQVYGRDKIEDVTVVTRPSGTIWNLTLHLPSFGILENMGQKKLSPFYQNVTNSMSPKAKKRSEFRISGSAHQGVFVDTKTLVLACSSPTSLKAFNTEGTEISFDSPIELKKKPSLSVSPTKNILYVGCLSSVYKLKIVKKKMNALAAMCMDEIKVKEYFDAFCVDEKQNRIVIATHSKITIVTLSPIYDVKTVLVPSPNLLSSMCLIEDRLTYVSGKEVVCLSLSGQQLFQYKIPKVQTIRCLAFDPLKNVYAGCSSRQGCGLYRGPLIGEYNHCWNCRYSKQEHVEVESVFQILKDGSNNLPFISDCPNTLFLFFDEYSEQLVVSDGSKCTVYRLCMQ